MVLDVKGLHTPQRPKELTIFGKFVSVVKF